METTTLTGAELRRRMNERGMRMGQLAVEAGVYPNDMSKILRGLLPVGASRRERIERAIVRLQLHREAPPAPKEPERATPVFRIRILG